MIAIKDHFSKDKIAELGHRFLNQNHSFPKDNFVKNASKNLSKLEYRQRVVQIANALYACFENFEDFTKSTLPVLEVWIQENRYYRNDFICESIGRVVEEKGLSHPELALDIIEGITQVFTAEWCIRPYVDKHFDTLQKRFEIWKNSENHHLRRLVSEGTRPNLPWGKKLDKLKDEPYFALPYIMHLAGDESEYVRKSVSNHLNDFAKQHPEKLLTLCKQLHKEKRISDKDLRQALRNLIKAGNAEAMALVGVNGFSGKLVSFKHTEKLQLGETFKIQLELLPKTNQKLEVDYVFAFRRKDGSHGNKVFKGHKAKATKNKALNLAFSITIKDISTRKYYAGVQKIAVQVNGKIFAESKFLLEVK